MTNERVKTLPVKELDHFLSTEIVFMNKRWKHGQEYKPATICNFQRIIAVQNEKKRRTDVSAYVWMILQQPTMNIAISLSIFCDAQVKIVHAFSEFQQTAAVETNVSNSVTNRSWSLVYIQHDLRSLIFVFKPVVPCSFWVARVIKNRRRKPFEFKRPEVRFNRKQTSTSAI